MTRRYRVTFMAYTSYDARSRLNGPHLIDFRRVPEMRVVGCVQFRRNFFTSSPHDPLNGAQRTDTCQLLEKVRVRRANRVAYFSGFICPSGAFCRFPLCREDHPMGINVGRRINSTSRLSFPSGNPETGRKLRVREELERERSEQEEFRYSVLSRVRGDSHSRDLLISISRGITFPTISIESSS